MSTLVANDSNANIELVKTLSRKEFSQNQVLADLVTCQAILEAGLRSEPPSLLALKYNNLFGIKGNGSGLEVDGDFILSINLPTKEYVGNKWTTELQPFAVNGSVEDSLEQHKRLLGLTRYKDVLIADTFSKAAYAIWKAGYATDPQYALLLMSIYNDYVKD